MLSLNSCLNLIIITINLLSLLAEYFTNSMIAFSVAQQEKH